MAMNTVRRIAAEVLGVGQSKVRINPESAQKAGEALTRDDVRDLISEGAIYALQPRGVSRLRGRVKRAQMRKGRRMGKGSRKGTFSARLSDKEAWMAKVRAQRKMLREMVSQGKVKEGTARKIYSMIKGNAFRGVKVLEAHLKESTAGKEK